MSDTRNRILDEVSKLITDAAGVAQGLKREAEGVVRTQAEKILNDLEVVQRDEFETVRAIAIAARDQAESFEARLKALEDKVSGKQE